MPKGVYPRKQWAEGFDEFVQSAASAERTIESVRREANRRFGLNITYQQMKGYFYRKDLPFKRNVRHNLLMSDEEAEYMASIIPGRLSRDVVRMMNEKFGSELTVRQVQAWKKNHKTPSGYDTRWRAGQKSWIKGRKFPGHTNAGCWEKGHIAFNNLPIGTIRRHDKYWVIKVRDGKLNENWELLHRHIWEQENGPIPEGHRLIFRDGNRDNVTLENIVCVSTQDAAVAVLKYGLTDDPDINDVILNVAKLKRKTRERRDKR